MLFLIKILGFIPLWMLYLIGDLLSALARYLYRGKEVLDSLRLAFPEKSEEELKKIRRQYYRNLMSVVAEVLKTTRLSKEQLRKRVNFVNSEVIKREFEQNRSIIAFAAHFCNWEWIIHAVSLHTPFTLDPIYKVQANPVLNQFIYDIRAKFGGVPIPKKNAIRNILKNKDKVRAIGFAADQRPFEKGAKVWLNFLNLETAFFPGTVALPYISQFPCYYMKIVRVKRGYYDIEAVKLGEPQFEKNDPSILKNYAKEIEKQIHEHPADWLWSHKRWKYKRASDEELLS